MLLGKFDIFIYNIKISTMANWSKVNLEKIVKNSKKRSDVLYILNIRTSGGNWKTLDKYLDLYKIDTSHFERPVGKNKKYDLSEVLIENSNFSRKNLKKRLYDEGLLDRICSLCNQNENWNNMKISLILDHINGVHNDNRIENLRIVCPNCNAGLDTFAGRNTIRIKKVNLCECGAKITNSSKNCNKCSGFKRSKVFNRPPQDQLMIEIEELGYSAVGRKYGVSDNAIRKWIKK